MKDPKNLFATPLIPGIITNLVNNGPIKKETLAFFQNHPDIAKQFALELYHTWSYKGILIQSPFLLPSFLGFFFLFLKKKKEALIIFLSGLLIFLITSKITIFWSGISQDSRYFLTSVAFLTLGLPYLLDAILNIRNLPVKITLFLPLIILLSIALYNGWYSNLTQFAPGNTGFYRFELKYLTQPLLSLNNFKLLFINTFPNIFNLPLLFIYFLPFLYPLIFRRKK